MKTVALWIGNDVVDLAEPGVARKTGDTRFMERVFTNHERARIAESPDPAREVWRFWAAKEAAFKVASTVRPGLVFEHRRFDVAACLTDGDGVSTGRVRYGTLDIPVRWVTTSDYVHCVGWWTACPADQAASFAGQHMVEAVAGAEWPLVGLLTPAEQASAYSPASARVRLLAHDVLGAWRVPHVEIIRTGSGVDWGPPIIVRRQRLLSGFDVSLSHDGRFVAAVVAGPGVAGA